MKLQQLSVIFIIIILPIAIVLDVNTSRDRDINATVNSFFNSLASGFSSSGYTKNDLKDYIPAMLFTLYDGYYVYGPYENNATIEDNKPTI